MLKMYHRGAHAGGAGFWDETWDDGQLEAAIRFCEVDPLRPLFEQHLSPGMLMLEGGCGRGQYVVYYGARGVKVVGFDFARGVLRRLKAFLPESRVCAGDVAALPFAAGSFDVYYSGGVVEHFEEGPDLALREAHRVLREGGLFLVSVPYASPLRQLSRSWRGDRRFVAQAGLDPPAAPRPGQFWQYAFTRRGFGRSLRAAGFRVIRTLPYAILFGLYDLPLVERVVSRLTRPLRAENPQRLSVTAVASTRLTAREGSSPQLTPSLVKRLVVAEDRTLPILGLMIRGCGRLCANMIMFVCEK